MEAWCHACVLHSYTHGRLWREDTPGDPHPRTPWGLRISLLVDLTAQVTSEGFSDAWFAADEPDSLGVVAFPNG